VLVATDELAADAGRAIFRDFVVIASAGGAKALRESDWGPLEGRDVVVWPRNDPVGKKDAAEVCRLALAAGARSATVVDVDDRLPVGWNLSDASPAEVNINDLRRLLIGRVTKAGDEHSQQRNSKRPNAPPQDNVVPDDPKPHTPLGPQPVLANEALHGIAGEIVRVATSDSEAHPAAVLLTALAHVATSFGRARYYRVGDTVHHARIYAAIVGASARARKGTSVEPVKRIMKAVEQIGGKVLVARVSPGPFSSGEGLLYSVRDGSEEPAGGDPGCQTND